MVTATEIKAAERTITNHLTALAKSIEVAWEFAHKAALAYNQADYTEGEYALSHSEDLQIAEFETAIEHLQSARTANAPAGVIAQLERRLLFRTNSTDTKLVDSEMDFQRHIPFGGLSENVAMATVSALERDDPTRVLWERSAEIKAAIFEELARRGEYFAPYTYREQQGMIATAVAEFTEKFIRPYMPAPALPGAFNREEEE
jgi:hypothetical protein